MERVIRFNLLCEELSDDEFALMISKCVARCERKVFSSALFHALQRHSEFVTPFVNIAANVISTRKSKANESHPNLTIYSADRLDELPSAVLSQCAAFLPTADYFAFGYCSRRIFKSIFLPSRIPTLSKRTFRKWLNRNRQPDLSKFASVSHLHLNLETFTDYVGSGSSSIWASSDRLTSLYIEDDFSNIGEKLMVLAHHVCLSNVKKLCVEDAHLKICYFSLYFPSLEHLDLMECAFPDGYAPMTGETLLALPKLKHFEHVNSHDVATTILSECSAQIEAMDIMGDTQLVNTIRFPKCTELSLNSGNNLFSGNSLDEMRSVLNRTPNVKTVTLVFQSRTSQEVARKTVRAIGHHVMGTPWGSNVMGRHGNVDTLRIHVLSKKSADVLDVILEEMAQCIHASRNVQRTSGRFYLEIMAHRGSQLPANWIISAKAAQLASVLETCRFTQFMLRIKLRERKKQGSEHAKLDVDSVNGRYSVCFEDTQCLDTVVSIANKGCTISVRDMADAVFTEARYESWRT